MMSEISLTCQKSIFIYDKFHFHFFLLKKIVVGSSNFLSANISVFHNQDNDSKHRPPCLYIFDTNRP
jgi:hypothetical protein